MLLKADQSVLLVIDLQEKLGPAIDRFDEVKQHAHWLLGVAQRLAVPAVATVQYPKGLGGMYPDLAALIPPDRLVEKLHFSAVAAGCLDGLAEMERRQVVLIGTETHVCVLQTALGLIGQGKEVYVVEDAVGSRRATDKALGLARMRQEGCRIVSREMVAFEWLHQAGTETFREVSKAFLR